MKIAPFKKSSEKDNNSVTVAYINKVFKKNNYTNKILHIVSKQIEDYNNNYSGTSQICNIPSSSKNGFNLETSPIFKIHEFSPEPFSKPSNEFNKSPEILKRINDQLSKLKISQGGKISALKDQLNFFKNFYPRPSFHDVQFQENHMHPQQNADGTGITEWNIDGMADGQICTKLQQMGMNVTAYKWKNSIDKQVAKRLVEEFTGTLRNLWDNYLIDQNIADILYAVANKSAIETEGG